MFFPNIKFDPLKLKFLAMIHLLVLWGSFVYLFGVFLGGLGGLVFVLGFLVLVVCFWCVFCLGFFFRICSDVTLYIFYQEEFNLSIPCNCSSGNWGPAVAAS